MVPILLAKHRKCPAECSSYFDCVTGGSLAWDAIQNNGMLLLSILSVSVVRYARKVNAYSLPVCCREPVGAPAQNFSHIYSHTAQAACR